MVKVTAEVIKMYFNAFQLKLVCHVFKIFYTFVIFTHFVIVQFIRFKVFYVL